MIRVRSLFLAIAIAVCGSLHADITVTFNARTVAAQGLTPGGGAVFFAVAHEPHDFYFTVKRVAELVPDQDRDGKVSYTAAAEIPWKSVWFVVDAQTGRYAIAHPAGFKARAITTRKSRAVKGSDGEWSLLEHERTAIEFLVIRPGGDVWSASAAQGGDSDLDKKGGRRYRTAVESLAPLTPKTRPLKSLNNGDVIIAIDTRRVEYFLASVE